MAETLNPFTPGMGAMPPFLAGREWLTTVLSEGLHQILAGEPGLGIVMYGPRGNGKTVLLGQMARDARASGARTYELASVVPTDDSKGSWELLGATSKADETTAKGSGGLFGFGASLEKKWFSEETVLGELQSNPGPALLLVDEAHALPPGLVKTLLHTVQRCFREGFPLQAVLVGTPGLPANLRKADASFWERATRLRIGRLESDDAVREALRRPAEESGLPFDDDALELLARESQAYPFFVQMLGRAAWREGHAQRREPRRITLADAQAGLAIANDAREEFYEERRQEIEDQGVLGMAETVSRLMVAQKDQRLHWRTVKGTVEADTPTGDAWPRAKEDLVKLERLGLIWKIRGGSWEPGIPSLCQYIVNEEGR